MFTRLGMGALFGAAVLGATGRIFAILEFYVLAAALTVAVLAALVWVWLNRFGTRTSRDVAPTRLHAYNEIDVIVEANNRYPLAPPIELLDSVEGVLKAKTHLAKIGTGDQKVDYNMVLTRRGTTTIGPMVVKTSDPFGFATTKHRGAPDTKVLVLPRIDIVSAPPKPTGSDMTRLELIASRQSPTGEEFSTLRNYVIGDDLRKVNWKASARSEDLIMRVDEVSEEGETLITLDLRQNAASADTFEAMVSATASLVCAASQRHDRIRLLSTHDHDIEIRDAHGYDQAMNWLALVKQKSDQRVKLPSRLRTRALRRSDVGVFICGQNPEKALGELWQRTNRELGSSVIVAFTPTTIATASTPAMTVLQVMPNADIPTPTDPSPYGSFVHVWQSKFASRVMS